MLRSRSIIKLTICLVVKSGEGLCDGDSGGPLTVQDARTGQHTLVGITSAGTDCGNVS